MPYDWVFAGSGFYKDVDTGEQRYLGDSGDLICVANFPTATMDLAVESAAANSGLVFEAFTENIPPMHTLVRLVLKVSDAEPSRESDVEPEIQLPPAKPAAGSAEKKTTEKQTPENKADSKTDAKAIAPETQEKTPKASDQDISLEEMIPSIELRKKPETK
jgi:hypothetical protein